MTPEEFKEKVQEFCDKYGGWAGEEGHMEMDDLMSECLQSLGYGEGLDILRNMKGVWYS